MMRACIPGMFLTAMLCATHACGQANQRAPHIGYVYPGGGRQNSTFEVQVGGQFLGGITDAYVSGQGVSASVIKHFPPIRNLSGEQRQALRDKLREAGARRWAEVAREGKVTGTPPWWFTPPKKKPADAESESTEEVKLPDHPLINDLESKSLRELQHVCDAVFNLQKQQLNPQIADSVLVEISVDRDATLGNRELRLAGRMGLTNPITFQVGSLPETNEHESNDPVEFDPLPREPPIDPPIVINGQIMPGDVDRIRFNAKRGQRFVIEVHARELIPFLADAVPGWFQAVLTLYDPEGNELASADDYRFDPDPVLFLKIPKTGVYELEIHDSIYRGRQDFVYRISISQQPFITQLFPLGGQSGQETVASIDGWNLAKKRLQLDTEAGAAGTHQIAMRRGKRLSNQVNYDVDTLNELIEVEPNDIEEDAQQLELPQIINGCIAQPGDVDQFQFQGKAGDEVVSEVIGRRLGSPLDSVLRLTDSSGTVLEWNDDYAHKDGHLHTDMGIQTHHADSYLRAQIPSDGTYFVQLTDSRSHGSAGFGYRLRISPPMHEFTLHMTPSSINVPASLAAPFDVYALRKDGFKGDIDVVLKGEPGGFRLSGATIPAGRDHIRMTLSAPSQPPDGPIALHLEGRAVVEGETIRRRVVPAEDMMQAFLYRHLVPSQELMVAVVGGKRAKSPVELADEAPIRLPLDGTARVHIDLQVNQVRRKIALQLNDAPLGISIGEVSTNRSELEFELMADGEVAHAGLVDNLIVEVFIEMNVGKKNNRGIQRTRRVSLGVLPAIPIEIVTQ